MRRDRKERLDAGGREQDNRGVEEDGCALYLYCVNVSLSNLRLFRRSLLCWAPPSEGAALRGHNCVRPAHISRGSIPAGPAPV